MIPLTFGRLDVALIVLCGLLLVMQTAIGLYFAVVFLRSPFRRPSPFPTDPPTTRFAVLIPARNEERVIRRVLDSLKALDYPPELLDLFVIADNCSDATASIAGACGAKVLERFDPTRRSKSQALEWAFYDCGLLDAGYDAFCIIDADNLVTPTFLRWIEAGIRAGHAVVQGRCESMNPFDSCSSSFSALLFTVGNRMWNLPLANRGVSVLNYGTGVAIRADHLRRIGWKVRTLVEDTEFGILTVLSGHDVHYCDAAEYVAEQPRDFATMWRQQRRWLSGIVECGRLYFRRLLRQAWKGRDASALTGVIKLLLPYNCIVGVAQTVLGAALTFSLLGPQVLSPFSVLMGLVYAQLTGMVSAFLILLFDGRLDRRMWKGILCFSLYPVFFGAVSLVSLLKPKKNWELIEHGEDLKKSAIRTYTAEV